MAARPTIRWLTACLVAVAWTAGVRAQVVLQFDYSLDANNFFNGHADRQLALQTAGQILAGRLTDSLSAITPGGGNTWTAVFPNPATGNLTNLTDLSIPANVIRVYTGGRALGTGGELGEGGPGGLSASGTQAFLDTVQGRGQPGALGAANSRTDFGPWGGSVAFDTGTNWNFSVVSGPTAGQSDFLSVALHELGHLLGFGTAPSFQNRSNAANFFTGTSASFLYDGNVPLTSDHGHWASGVNYGGQEAAMTPSILVGTRKAFTELDFAGLRDLGWQVAAVPEPSSVVLGGLGLLGFVAVRRRRAAA
jgi:PEP-CTERM motif